MRNSEAARRSELEHQKFDREESPFESEKSMPSREVAGTFGRGVLRIYGDNVKIETADHIDSADIQPSGVESDQQIFYHNQNTNNSLEIKAGPTESPGLAEMHRLWNFGEYGDGLVSSELQSKLRWNTLAQIADTAYKYGQNSEIGYRKYFYDAAKVVSDELELGNITEDMSKAVRGYNNIRRFENIDPQTLFYATVSKDNARLPFISKRLSDMAVSPLENTPEGLDPDKVHVSYDSYDQDGKLISGAGQLQSNADDITFVFSKKLLDDNLIDGTVKFPSLAVPVRIDNEQDGALAILCEDLTVAKELMELNKKFKTALPIFTKEMWQQLGDHPEDHVRAMRRMNIERRDQEKQEWLRREAITDVDQAEVERVTDEYLEKIDRQKVEDLYNEILKDQEAGEQAAMEYFGEIFEVSRIPHLEHYNDPEDSAGGSNTADLRGRLVRINDAWCRKSDIPRSMQIISHEMWHERQYQMEFSSTDERAELYAYNRQNYVRLYDDPEGYRAQLIECEAYRVGDTVESMLKEFHDVRMRSLAIEDVNQQELQEEVDQRFSKISIDEIQKIIGAKNWQETETKLVEDFEQVGPALVDYLSEQIGVKNPPKLEFDTREEGFTFNFISNRLRYGPGVIEQTAPSMILRSLASYTWNSLQLQRALDPSDERGEIYRYNFNNFVPSSQNPDEFKEQIINSESEYFANRIVKDAMFYAEQEIEEDE